MSGLFDHGLAAHVLAFLFVCAAVGLATSQVRESDWRRIAGETWRFFAMMALGIAGFSAVVYLLEWAFIRKL